MDVMKKTMDGRRGARVENKYGIESEIAKRRKKKTKKRVGSW